MNMPIFSPRIAQPMSLYSHAVQVQAGARMLFVSGQIPVRRDGSSPTSFAEQAELCWSNLAEVLRQGGMAIEDMVRLQGYVTNASDLSVYNEIRNKWMGATRCASTLLVVAALADPSWVIELEAVAAQA